MSTVSNQVNVEQQLFYTTNKAEKAVIGETPKPPFIKPPLKKTKAMRNLFENVYIV
jgi:hypothetical protein